MFMIASTINSVIIIKKVAGVLSRHAPRPSSLHPSPRGEPLQLRALRGARRATPQPIIGYHGI